MVEVVLKEDVEIVQMEVVDLELLELLLLVIKEVVQVLIQFFRQ